MEMGRPNVDLVLDEEDTESDTPLTSSIMAQTTSGEKLVEWAQKNVGDTHMCKRKVQFVLPKVRKKAVASDNGTESGDKSPLYQEYVDSSSVTSFDDGGGAGGAGGCCSSVGGSGGGESEMVPPIHSQVPLNWVLNK
jgi:hypothetical protein